MPVFVSRLDALIYIDKEVELWYILATNFIQPISQLIVVTVSSDTTVDLLLTPLKLNISVNMSLHDSLQFKKPWYDNCLLCFICGEDKMT